MIWKQFAQPRSTIICRWNNAPSAAQTSPLLPHSCGMPHSSWQPICYSHRPFRRQVITFPESVRYMHDSLSKSPSTSADRRIPREAELPTKEQLFYVDWLTDTLVPKFLSDRESFVNFMKMCTKDVVYDDSIFKRHAEGVDKFIRHVSLSQLYFSLMRAASSFEKLGSCIYENDDVVVVLWRLTSIRLYQQQQDIVEGALDIHLTKDGQIYKIDNRPITRNDREGAAVLLTLKEEAAKKGTSEVSSSKMQMRTMWRCLVRFAAPSSAFLLLSRAYSSGRGNGGPEMFQLEHIRKRLELTVPQFFREQPDYTIYRPEVEYRDEIFQVTVRGRDRLMAYMGTLSVVCLFCYPHIEMEALSILPISEDGTVRLRWRVKHVSLIRALFNPMLFKYDYRVKRLKWYDGLTTFYVGRDGLVYRVVTRRTIEDERKNAQANRLADLAQKVGVLPKGSAAFIVTK